MAGKGGIIISILFLSLIACGDKNYHLRVNYEGDIFNLSNVSFASGNVTSLEFLPASINHKPVLIKISNIQRLTFARFSREIYDPQRPSLGWHSEWKPELTQDERRIADTLISENLPSTNVILVLFKNGDFKAYYFNYIVWMKGTYELKTKSDNEVGGRSEWELTSGYILEFI